MTTAKEKLFQAIEDKDIAAMQAILSAGFDQIDEFDDKYHDMTPLQAASGSWDDEFREKAVCLLLEYGADPNIMDEGVGALFMAILNDERTGFKVVQILLDAGANPDYVFDDTHESLYDWVEFDYRYEKFDLKLPFEPDNDSYKNQEDWLDFLDRCAAHNRVQPPTILRLLRKYGAKTTREMRAQK